MQSREVYAEMKKIMTKMTVEQRTAFLDLFIQQEKVWQQQNKYQCLIEKENGYCASIEEDCKKLNFAMMTENKEEETHFTNTLNTCINWLCIIREKKSEVVKAINIGRYDLQKARKKFEDLDCVEIY